MTLDWLVMTMKLGNRLICLFQRERYDTQRQRFDPFIGRHLSALPCGVIAMGVSPAAFRHTPAAIGCSCRTAEKRDGNPAERLIGQISLPSFTSPTADAQQGQGGATYAIVDRLM